MGEEERQDVTIGVPSASAGGAPVGEEPEPEPEPEDEEAEDG